MADKDTVAAAARRYKPIQSAVPGTTLGPIQIDAFQVGVCFLLSFMVSGYDLQAVFILQYNDFRLFVCILSLCRSGILFII